MLHIIFNLIQQLSIIKHACKSQNLQGRTLHSNSELIQNKNQAENLEHISTKLCTSKMCEIVKITRFCHGDI